MSYKSKNKRSIVVDIEISPNAYLIGFKSVDTNKVLQYELFGKDAKFDNDTKIKIKKILNKYMIVSFNGVKYDIPMILKSMQDVTVYELYEMSNTVIKEGMPQWLTLKNYGISYPKTITHVDLIEPAPGVGISLKLYGGRLHSKTIQDLPYAYDKELTREEFEHIKTYNINDLDTTIDLYNRVKPAIDLRFEISKINEMDLLSKGDAQIAEAVVVKQLTKLGINFKKKTQLPADYFIQYEAPDCIKFESRQLKDLLKLVTTYKFTLDGRGSPKLPPELTKSKITIGKTTYKVGLGGLHSNEKKTAFIGNMKNADVTSYYPSMIIEYGFTPKKFGDKFLTVYKKFYYQRNDPVTGAKVMMSKIKQQIKDLTNG